MKEIIKQLTPLFEARVFAYDILRRTFVSEPSADYLKLMAEQGIEAFPFVSENEQIALGISQLKDFVVKNDLTSESVYNKLHWDYTRMFIGPYKLPAPLWESAYENEERMLFQQETLKVRASYLKYNFLPVHFKQEADDHLGLELDFMYQLSVMALNQLMASDVEGYREILGDQSAFLSEHLLKWVPKLRKDIVENAHTGFYQGIADVLNGFLVLDLEALEELLGMEL